MRSSTLARRIAALTLTKKAHDLVILDLRKLTTMTDYFVICSGDSDIQVKAIAETVNEEMEKHGARPWHRETGSANWILLDYVDVVLHVFQKQARSFYNLEKLWGDAAIHRIEDKAPAPSPRRRRVARQSNRSSPRPSSS